MIGVKVQFASIKDAEGIVTVLREAAGWMRLKGTPAWDTSVLNRAFVEKSIAATETLIALNEGLVVGACTLSRSDPEFWPDAPEGYAANLHKLAVMRLHAGGSVSTLLIAECERIARQWGCAKLRLDCHPNLRGLYERLGFTHVDTFNKDAAFIVERLEVTL